MRIWWRLLGVGVLAMPLTVGAHEVTAAGGGGVRAPRAMAAVGDSLSSGFPGQADASWPTGSASTSHASRLKALNPDLVAYNYAQPGMLVSAFVAQAASVVSHQDVGYVTVMFGANDVCNPTGGVPTSAADFRTRFRAGLQVLASGLRRVKILVVSLPDLRSMQAAMIAAGRPGTAVYCTRFFANPTSTDVADVSRRNRVMTEVRTFNRIMAEECGLVEGCRSDGGAMYRHEWVNAEIGSDGSHPTPRGQRAIAALTWQAGFRWVTRTG